MPARHPPGRGWIALIVDDEEEPETPDYVVTYCPTCTEREFRKRFGSHQRVLTKRA